jgi:Zn-dependent protease with chaperone function
VCEPDDFQRPIDGELTAYLQSIEQTVASKWLKEKVVRPFYDDVQTAKLEADAVELVQGQFPHFKRFSRLVNQCSTILKVHPPRVFVTGSDGSLLRSANSCDPILVVNGALLDQFTDDREIRFLIGRELGHIRCGHTKWLGLQRTILRSNASFVPVPKEFMFAPFLPLLKWSREAEMSADNAGLICCQNREAAEQAILRQLHGLTASRADPDLFLAQTHNEQLSQFAEAVRYWRQISSPAPFAADRIQQLREYENSNRYRHLW